MVKGGAQTLHTAAALTNVPARMAGVGDATGLPTSFKPPQEYQTQGVAEGVGAGLEGIGEFLLGDGALKGLPLLQRAEAALKAEKALKLAAEQSPLVQKILTVGLKALRVGTVSGAQSWLHDPSTSSAATGAAFGVGGELTGEAARFGVSKLIPRTLEAINSAAKAGVEEAAGQRQTAAREIGNIATKATGETTGSAIPDADNFRDAAKEIRSTFNPTYDKIREATGGVLNPSTGRYSANAFDDATQQIARSKKVIYSPSPASTQALKDAEKELAEGETKLQTLFDSNAGSKSEIEAAKAGWRKAAILDDLHGYLDKAFSEPAGVRASSGVPAEIDPKKFIQAANKAIDKIGSDKLADAMGPENFRDLQTLRSQLAARMGEQEFGKSLEQGARKYLAEVGTPSQSPRMAGGPLAGGSVALLAHLLGASNPVSATVGSTATLIHWLYTHPDQGVKVLGYVQKAAPVGAQAAKQVIGKDIANYVNPVAPADQ